MPSRLLLVSVGRLRVTLRFPGPRAREYVDPGWPLLVTGWYGTITRPL